MAAKARKLLRVFARGSLFVVLVLFIITLIFVGLQYYKYWPRAGDSYYVHSLHIPVYNKSKTQIEWEEWTRIVKIVNKSLETLKSCLGADAEEELLNVSIVILPPETVFHFQEAVEGFVGLKYVFIRRDLFDESRLIHEWLHVYFFLTYQWGDNFFHRSPLFKKCR